MRRPLTTILLCSLIIGCKSARQLTGVLPPAAIDSLGKVSIQHTQEISYFPTGDTLIYRHLISLPDYKDSTIEIHNGTMTVRLPKPAAKQIKETTVVEIPVYKENMGRVQQMQQKHDSLLQKNQAVAGQLRSLTTYRTIVWTVMALVLGLVVLLLLILWIRGKLGFIGSIFGGIGKFFGGLFSRKK